MFSAAFDLRNSRPSPTNYFVSSLIIKQNQTSRGIPFGSKVERLIGNIANSYTIPNSVSTSRYNPGKPFLGLVPQRNSSVYTLFFTLCVVLKLCVLLTKIFVMKTKQNSSGLSRGNTTSRKCAQTTLNTHTKWPEQ